jgi:hypothetical protein
MYKDDAKRQVDDGFTRSLNHVIRWIAGILIILFFGFPGFMAETHAASIIIVNKDGPGEGFNDSTPFTPIGGNTAMTLGQARLNAFEHAADILANVLVSAVGIQVDARIDPLGPGILGSAGPNTVHRDFSNAPVANTWYVQALANKLAGQDLDPTTSDINATFSSNFNNWYFGLDANPPIGQFDFATVVLHEIIHGLGFLSLVDILTGEKFLGANDVFMIWLERHGALPSNYPSMTDIQRQDASIAEHTLHFIGTTLQAASGILTAGVTGSHVHMYAPNPVQPGSSVSHFTNIIKPDQLMEPGIASGKALHDLGLAQPLLQDLGWTFDAGITVSTRNDVNGDSKADLVWRHMSNWRVAIWLMNGSSIASSGFFSAVPTEWQIVGIDDVDGDGKADIIWRNNNTGTVAVWLMNDLTVMSVGFPGGTSTNWQIAGVGDVNGDGKADLVWRHSSNLEIVVWFMNGSVIASSGVLGSVSQEWQISEIGDVNENGKADIIWHNTNTGTVAIWMMNGLTVTSVGFPGSTSSDWQIAGAGDVDGDGKADLVWRNMNSGAVVIWLMNGTSIASSGLLGGVSLDWQIAEIGDANGNGKGDIIWRNSQTGTVAVWLMNGLTVVSVGFPGSTSTDWKIQN